MATAVGHALADGGDTNGDGLHDLLVGAPGAGGGGVWIVEGPAVLDTLDLTRAQLVYDGDGDMASLSVAGLGDTDGDGYDDLAVAVPDDGPPEALGRAFVFRGPFTDEARPFGGADALFETEMDPEAWGPGVVTGPLDVDTDGLMDLLAGSRNWGEDPLAAGAAFLWRGPLDGSHTTADADVRMLGALEFSMAGDAVANGGDLDLDGYPDLLVGARAYPVGDLNVDAGLLVLGGPPP